MSGPVLCRMIRTREVGGCARVRDSEVVLSAEDAAAEARRGSLVILEAVEAAAMELPAEEAAPELASDEPAEPTISKRGRRSS